MRDVRRSRAFEPIYDDGDTQRSSQLLGENVETFSRHRRQGGATGALRTHVGKLF